MAALGYEYTSAGLVLAEPSTRDLAEPPACFAAQRVQIGLVFAAMVGFPPL